MKFYDLSFGSDYYNASLSCLFAKLKPVVSAFVYYSCMLNNAPLDMLPNHQ